MAAHPYILARTIKEAHDYARGPLGLEHGTYRIVNSPSTLKAVRGAELYLVPGWQNRHDRFAMKGALRWTRMIVIDVAEQAEAPAEPDEDAPLSDFEATDFVLDLAWALEDPDHRSALGITSTADPEPQAEAPAELDTKRRRRRCKKCGNLFEPDEIEAHAASCEV